MFSRLFVSAFAVMFFLGISLIAQARVWQEGEQRSESDGTNTIPYRLYLPENYDPTIKYPLVTFLHGAGERGSDNTIQVMRYIRGLINKTDTQYPSVLIAPQTPFGWSTTSTRELVESIVLGTIDEFSVDTNRLYLTGLSMGGFGTISMLDYYTNVEPGLFQFAAASPLSAGITTLEDLSETPPWKDTPIWLAHGSFDRVVPDSWSRNAYRAFTGGGRGSPIVPTTTAFGEPTAIDGNIRYTQFVGAGHNIWDPVYSSDEFYDWMFAQSLVPEPTGLALAWVAGVLCLSRRNVSRHICCG